MRISLALAAVVLLGSASVAGAAPPAAQYSPDDFVRAILTGPQPCPAGRSIEDCEANPKTRRFSLVHAPSQAQQPAPPPVAAAPAAHGRRHAPPPPPRPKPVVTSTDTLVTFALGSAEITPQGKANLRSAAAGLNKDVLAPLNFEVAGFTDVVGTPEQNMALSQRRADAVKAYLISVGVAETRLTPKGYGMGHLAFPDQPHAEGNRRVELHRLN